LTIVGARPPVAELSDRSRVLLGFVVADDEAAKVAAVRASDESGESKSKSDPKPSGIAAKAPPAALSPAELPALLATFVRTAVTTPANELRWPTSGGGMLLRRLPAERGDATDTVWIAEGAPEDLRLLLGQVGAVAGEARWQVQSGEFAPELQQRVLAAAAPSPPSPDAAGAPTGTTGGAGRGELGPAAPLPQPGGRGAGAPAGGSSAAPPSGEAAPAGALRRRVVLRFRLAP
jgi:hypothetical protein